MDSVSQRISVLICSCEGEIPKKVDLATLRDWLVQKHPMVNIEIHDALCKEPNEIGVSIKRNNVTNMIVGACSKYRGVFDDTGAKANLNPLCLKTVSLLERCALVHPTCDASEKAKIMLSSEIARELKSEKGTNENLRLMMNPINEKMDRRSFLTFPIKFRSQIIPTINHEHCVGWQGCDTCIRVCPKKAFSKQEQKIHINVSKCGGCGICMVACPVRAIFFPSQSPSEIDAKLRTLVSANSTVLNPRIILFACADGISLIDKLGRAGLSYPANMMVVEVPCIGMINPFFQLRAFELGAEAVGIIPCEPKCRFKYDLNKVDESVHATKEMLKVFSIDPQRIRIIPQNHGDLKVFSLQLKHFADKMLQLGSTPLDKKKPSELDHSWSNMLFMVKQISDTLGVDRAIRSTDPSLPFLMISVDPEKCSMCGLCVSHCPTGALSLKKREELVRLMFDYGLCLACAICLKHCPESAMRGESMLDIGKLTTPTSVLAEDKMSVCQMCKTTFSTEKQIKTVTSRLSSKSVHYAHMISSFCPNCRMKAWLHESLK